MWAPVIFMILALQTLYVGQTEGRDRDKDVKKKKIKKEKRGVGGRQSKKNAKEKYTSRY